MTGKIRKTDIGKFEIDGGQLIGSGDVVKLQTPDGWITTRVEYSHDRKAYYYVEIGELLFDGDILSDEV